MTDADTQSAPAIHPLIAALAAMPIVRTLGVRITHIGKGEVEMEMPFDERWTFRAGQWQATPMFAVADFAVVCAGATLLADGWNVSTVDCTLKIVGPALEGPLRARAKVVKAGKLLTVSSADVYSLTATGESLCATALVTARNLPPSA
ncbi:MAG: PaaI family thioesterase [Burkholderiales bacterium]